MMASEDKMKIRVTIDNMSELVKKNIIEIIDSTHLETSQKTDMINWLNRNVEPDHLTMRALYAYHSEIADMIDMSIELRQLINYS